MTSNDLVGQLRKIADSAIPLTNIDRENVATVRLAADTLEQQDAELARLRRALAGHLFDGESLSTREAIRSELIVQQFQENERLTDAIRWALGEAGSFPTRQEGQGAYSWRTELRRRAALEPKP